MESRTRTTGRPGGMSLKARLDLLCGLASDVAALKGEEPTLHRVIETAAEAIGIATAHVAIVDREQKTLFGVVSSGRHPKHAPRARFALNRSLGALTALRMRKPVVIRDARRDRRVHPEARTRFGIGSVAYVPLLAGKEAFGLLILTTPRPYRWSAQQVRLAGY